MLTVLSAIVAEQADPTQHLLQNIHQFLHLATMQWETSEAYKASDMILAVHCETSYLSKSKAWSRAGGHFFLSSNEKFPCNNGTIHNIAKFIWAVMSSAAEAKLGAIFINAKQAVAIRATLTEMGHPQLSTPIQMDNSTTMGVITNTFLAKAITEMNMHFHWLRNWEQH